MVRKVVVALRLVAESEGVAAALQVVVRQRTSYLRRMRSLQGMRADVDEVAGRLASRHAVLHLDADLRWLDEVADVLGRLAARPKAEVGRDRTCERRGGAAEAPPAVVVSGVEHFYGVHAVVAGSVVDGSTR